MPALPENKVKPPVIECNSLKLGSATHVKRPATVVLHKTLPGGMGWVGHGLEG